MIQATKMTKTMIRWLSPLRLQPPKRCWCSGHHRSHCGRPYTSCCRRLVRLGPGCQSCQSQSRRSSERDRKADTQVGRHAIKQAGSSQPAKMTKKKPKRHKPQHTPHTHTHTHTTNTHRETERTREREREGAGGVCVCVLYVTCCRRSNPSLHTAHQST